MQNNFSAFLLAAGMGTRLRPLTLNWPKALMPIKNKPLLGLWLSVLMENQCQQVFINTSHQADKVNIFLEKPLYRRWVTALHESSLLGTAGTLAMNYEHIKNKTILLIHADNLCVCSFSKFLDQHFLGDREKYPITMMTFESDNPESCGIVDLNDDKVVINIHEKKRGVRGTLANAAVYLIEPEVIDWIFANKNVSDFTLDVLPNYYSRIKTWRNDGVLRDIGTPPSLRLAQLEDIGIPKFYEVDQWDELFYKNSVFNFLKSD